MKKFLGIIFILAIFVGLPIIVSAQPMPQTVGGGGTIAPAPAPIPSTVDGTGTVDPGTGTGPFKTQTAPMPTPEPPPIRCWGCTPEASDCPKTQNACHPNKETGNCEVNCNCLKTPPGFAEINNGRCVQIYDGQPAYQGCYCVQCGYAL